MKPVILADHHPAIPVIVPHAKTPSNHQNWERNELAENAAGKMPTASVPAIETSRLLRSVS
jgi:hypothetical protein